MNADIREPFDVSIILPTYNEVENLPILIPQIFESLAPHELKAEVIVVDDHSPDHTAATARRLGDTYPVRVVERLYERGLATAVIRGFQVSQASVCVVMDADGSHPISKLADMILPILQGKADVTVGSRNIPEGGSFQWPWYRKVISKTAALMTLGLTKMTDPTSGFMGVRRSQLSGLNLDPIGWKIVLEVVVKLGKPALVEVPIMFHDRQFGKSKMSPRQQGLYLMHLFKLYIYKLFNRKKA